jgi:hypothetical protein
MGHWIFLAMIGQRNSVPTVSCQIMMEDARKYGTQQIGGMGIGLLSDQEKAYNKVNLRYLKVVLLRFVFFTEEVHKLRGLKQGDPISAILYNLAFEPFLGSILNDALFQGYNLIADSAVATTVGTVLNEAINTKILCYADDALVFLQDVDDLSRLKIHRRRFAMRLMLQFNFNKIEAFSLSGINIWSCCSTPLTNMSINKLVTVEVPNPITYLRLPVIQSTRQRSNFVGVDICIVL